MKSLAFLAIVGADLLALSWFLFGLDSYRLDIDVYRLGSYAWMNGEPLYGRLPDTEIGLNLPFSYPPVAAALLSPLTLVSLEAAGALTTVLTVMLLAVVIAVLLGSLRVRPTGRSAWLLVGILLPVAIFLEPVRSTLFYGQINVVLMVLVVLDCLVKTPRWPRGVLVGLAAAVKLTPAAFVLFFLLRRDHRSALRAVLSFGITSAMGFLLAWGDSVRFWSETLYDAGRVGTVHFAANQSVLGVLARFGIESPGRAAVWLPCVVLVVIVAVAGMRRAFAAGSPALALAVNAVAALCVSPVSWSHHWVWAVPAVLSLLVVGWRARARLAVSVALGGFGLFVAGPHWWFPDTRDIEYQWGLGQQLLGNSYVYFAMLFLMVATSVRPEVCKGCEPATQTRGRGRLPPVRGRRGRPAGAAGLPAVRGPALRRGPGAGLPDQDVSGVAEDRTAGGGGHLCPAGAAAVLVERATPTLAALGVTGRRRARPAR